MEHIYVQKDEHPEEAEEATIVEQQTAQLENELAIKERETLDLLKELESTKKIITELKLKIHKETAETYQVVKSEETDRVSVVETEDCKDVGMEFKEGNSRQPTSSVSVELEQAKESLNKTTSDLAAVRAAVELLRNSITKEQMLLERSRQKLSANTTLISSLEEELDRTTQKLETLKDLQQRRKDPADIFIEIKKVTSEVQQLRSMANDSESEATVLAAEIEQAKASISIAEVRCIAAKKMEGAARAAEALALAEVKALLSSESPSEGNTASDGVTLPAEEYFALFSKAREADEISRKTEEDAMLQVETANSSESESVKRLEDAKIEVEECKQALQEALKRVEAANHGKLAVEEILRRWKSESGHKKRSIGGSPKFENSDHRRKDSYTTDIAADASDRSIKPTLSIGQILSMKLMGPDEYDKSVWDDKTSEAPNISLGQILNRSVVLCKEDMPARKRVSGKRKKFALNGLSVLLAKQSKSKKKRESL
jgi:hypothetical protein